MFESFHLKWKLSNILPYKLQAFFNFSILGHHFSRCFYIVSKFSMLWFICLIKKVICRRFLNWRYSSVAYQAESNIHS